MASPRRAKTQAAKPKAPPPAPAATVVPAKLPSREAETPLRKPSLAPRPTLWQRLWYGKNAETRVMQGDVVARMHEVKTGVLQEMQHMSKQGGVSGSPFSTVVLPRETVSPRPAHRREERKLRGAWVWLLVLLGVAILLWLALNDILRREQLLPRPTEELTVPGVLLPPALQEELPPVAEEPLTLTPPADLEDFPATPEVVTVVPLPSSAPLPPGIARPGQPAGQPAPLTAPRLSGAALTAVLQSRVLEGVGIENATNGAVSLRLELANTTAAPLTGVQLQLTVTDTIDQLLWQETFTLEEPVQPGTTTRRVTLPVPATKPQQFVATTPLDALQVRLVPVGAN